MFLSVDYDGCTYFEHVKFKCIREKLICNLITGVSKNFKNLTQIIKLLSSYLNFGKMTKIYEKFNKSFICFKINNYVTDAMHLRHIFIANFNRLGKTDIV